MNLSRILILLALSGPASAADATYPADCQIEMLATAIPALKSDRAFEANFFDLEKISFTFSNSGEPMVVFDGHGFAKELHQICSAAVILIVPEETSGCPPYEVKSVGVSCKE